MKKTLKIVLIILIVLVICWLLMFLTDYIRCSKIQMPIFTVAGETADDGGSGTYYGLGYRVEVEKRISAEYGVQIGQIEMYIFNKCIAGGIVEFADEEKSNYQQKFKLTYNQRKDLGIKTIIDKNTSQDYEFSIYTFGGDVSITIDTDKVYDLKTALGQRVITVDDILEQAKKDAKNGICEEGHYLDGGSIEYDYGDYTILKYNDLDGHKDLVIGMSGQIIYQVNKFLYNE